MSTKKKKTLNPAVVYTSEAGLRGGLNELVTLKLEVVKADASTSLAVTKLNEITAEANKPKLERIAVLESSIALYCTNHRAELFPNDDPKSKTYENATVGFRFGTHSVGLLIEKDTDALAAMRIESAVDEATEARLEGDESVESLAWLADFIVMKPALDKKRLLSKRDQLTKAQIQKLRDLGVIFEQSENFFIDPIAEQADRVTKTIADAA
jgi:phage host-nuclease inhibitor protein Gam